MPRTATRATTKAADRPRGAEPTSGQVAAAAETDDHEYAIVSVLYHALQGVQACDQYINDAQRASDDELMRFFVESRDEQAARAKRAKSLLSNRMDVEEDDEEEDDEEEDDEEEDDEEEDEE